MAMRQSLDMRQGQSLVMTPQLQQAIKLLQLSNQELQEFVEAEIERNPLLERADSSAAPEEGGSDRRSDDGKDLGVREELGASGSREIGAASEALDAPTEDVANGDSGSDAAGSASRTGPSAETDWSRAGSGKSLGEDLDLESRLTSEKSLREHLSDQLTLATLPPADAMIAARLIDETDDSGYCRADLAEVASALGASSEQVEAVLKICQGFEPTGVMARSIPECMALQLAERNRLDPAMQALLDNLELAAKQDIAALVSICGVDKSEIADMLIELRTLTPRPGSAFAGDAVIAVAPDVFVREMPDGLFSVELN
ncbi:MAG: RNA polymerase sigma-54 factor, partial [Pseudomonadota bacterium]